MLPIRAKQDVNNQTEHLAGTFVPKLSHYARIARMLMLESTECKAYFDIGLLFRYQLCKMPETSPLCPAPRLCRIAIISIFKYSLQDVDVWVCLSLWLITQVVIVCGNCCFTLDFHRLRSAYSEWDWYMDWTQRGAWHFFHSPEGRKTHKKEACMLVTWELRLFPFSCHLIAEPVIEISANLHGWAGWFF